jgi:hypothetical protein
MTKWQIHPMTEAQIADLRLADVLEAIRLEFAKEKLLPTHPEIPGQVQEDMIWARIRKENGDADD